MKESDGYRLLKKGEIVLETDQYYDDDKGQWVAPLSSVGYPAPDPMFTSHRVFRRAVASDSISPLTAFPLLTGPGYGPSPHPLEDIANFVAHCRARLHCPILPAELLNVSDHGSEPYARIQLEMFEAKLWGKKP